MIRRGEDVPGWNRLLDVLDAVEKRQNSRFTENIFRQVLLEIYRRQQTCASVIRFRRE